MKCRLFLVLSAAAAVAAAVPLAPTQLQIEYQPSGTAVVGAQKPRLSWAPEATPTDRAVSQLAYQIAVSRAFPAEAHAEVWDSGKVLSSAVAHVELAATLASDELYHWSVRWWDDASGAASDWAHASFRTGMLLGRKEWSGAWIAGAGNQLRREFVLKDRQIARGTLHIAGLGWYVAQLNGERVGRLVSGHFTTFERTVLHETIDVTSFLRRGAANALAVTLGNGWYVYHKVGPQSLICQLSVVFDDGTREIVVASDERWKAAPGPIVSDHVFIGEDYDARRETPGWTLPGFNDSSWAAAKVVTGPSGELRPAQNPPIIAAERYNALKMTEPKPGVYVFDFGQNIAGVARLHVCGPAGTVVTMQHAETLKEDGLIDPLYNNPSDPFDYSPMIDHYTLRGDPDCETYEPTFTWHGFQYVQLSGLPSVPSPEDTVEAIFWHADLRHTGSITFDNEALNWVQRALRFSALSNLFDIPMDCPTRERHGWLGDAQVVAETEMMNFDLASLWTKWVQDIRDVQVFENLNGSIADIAPYYNWGVCRVPADPGWGAAFVLVPLWMYKHYGDRRILETHYDGIRAYVEHLRTLADPATKLMTFQRWGDWKTVVPITFDTSFPTFYYTLDLDSLAQIASILGKTADATLYSQLAKEIRAAWNQHLFNASAHFYENGWQSEQVFPLTLDVVPASERSSVVKALLSDIASRGNLPDVGIFSQKYLFPLLTALGRTDLAFLLATTAAAPGLYHWHEEGATTLWENPASTRFCCAPWSRNHVMWAGHGAWFYNTLAGIAMAPDGVAFDKITIAPQVSGVSMQYAAADIETHRGKISSSWARVGGNGLCAVVAEKAEAHLACARGVIGTIEFASFGTPTGNCSTGLAIDSKCHAASSMSVVQKACIGKQECSVPATNAAFGGDPCENVPKFLAVRASGCKAARFVLNATVPVGAVAEVSVPIEGSATIIESGSTCWENGAFVPGVPGIFGAALAKDASAVAFKTGSGSFSFSVLL